MTNIARFVRFSGRKVPLAVGGGNASSTDPSTWSTYTEALASSRGVGIGFVLAGDGIGVIDLDHCITDGVVAPWARSVVDANRGTFMETSRSGTGIHIWGLLEPRPGRKIRDGERNIEVYSTGRYIALHEPLAGSSRELLPLVLPS